MSLGVKDPNLKFKEVSWLVNCILKFGYENRGALGCLVTRGVRRDTPTTGSSSDLLLDPRSERGVNVGLKGVISIHSSRDQYGPFRGRSGRVIPVANHSPSFPKCFIDAPSWTSLGRLSLELGFAMRKRRLEHPFDRSK